MKKKVNSTTLSSLTCIFQNGDVLYSIRVNPNFVVCVAHIFVPFLASKCSKTCQLALYCNANTVHWQIDSSPWLKSGYSFTAGRKRTFKKKWGMKIDTIAESNINTRVTHHFPNVEYPSLILLMEVLRFI